MICKANDLFVAFIDHLLSVDILSKLKNKKPQQLSGSFDPEVEEPKIAASQRRRRPIKPARPRSAIAPGAGTGVELMNTLSMRFEPVAPPAADSERKRKITLA